MSLFKKLSDWFEEYCESDDVADGVFKREYYYLTYLSGLYANLHKKFRFLSALNFLVINGIFLFHLFVVGRTCLIVQKYNFTLFTFHFQMYPLIFTMMVALGALESTDWIDRKVPRASSSSLKFLMFMLIQCILLILLSVSAKRKTFRLLVREMVGTEIAYEEEDHIELLERLKKEGWKEKKRLLLLPVLLCLIGANCILLSEVIDNKFGDPGFDREESGLFTMAPIPMAYPWKATEGNWLGDFMVVGLLQTVAAIYLISIVASATITLINILFAYNLHLKFLIWNINQVESRAKALLRRSSQTKGFGEREGLNGDLRYQKCIRICLKKTFVHHQHIVRWFDGIQDLISLPAAITYSTGTVVIALSVIGIKSVNSLPGTALTSALLVIHEVAVMAVISLVGQRMTDLNEDLRQAMYNTKWYLAHPHIKTDIMIFQEMLKRPVELKAGGLVPCNLDTFSNVMNSAYSYYNLFMAF